MTTWKDLLFELDKEVERDIKKEYDDLFKDVQHDERFKTDDAKHNYVTWALLMRYIPRTDEAIKTLFPSITPKGWKITKEIQ